MISGCVFLFICLIKLVALPVIFSVVVLGIIVIGHQGWFECAMMEKFLVLVLLAGNLNELFFVLVHLDASLVESSAWVHDPGEGVIVAILCKARGAFTSM